MLRVEYDDARDMYWTDTHDKDKARRYLYNEAWEIIVEMLWRPDSDLYFERQHERLSFIKDALFVLDQMDKN